MAPMAPAQQQQPNDRSPFASASSSPADMHRPRRHLPSPALAQATSLLKLTQTYGSFDICELSGLHLSSLTSSPSAPVVSSSPGLTAAGRRLPVPGRMHATNNLHKMSSGHHLSQSDLMMAGVADAMDEMDALIRCGSASMGTISSGGGVAGGSGSVRDSPKLSSSRKLPVPPVSAAAKVINQSRRLLPRPLSCDVPCVSDTDLLGAGLQQPSTYLSSQQRASSSRLCRPFSFDYGGVDAELDEAAGLFQQQQQHHHHLLHTGGSTGSDPSLVFLDGGLSATVSSRRGLTRQTSTTSCPALVRPCALSPRSPKYRTTTMNDSLNGSLSGGSSLNTTPSPLPLLYPNLLANATTTTSTTTDPTAYVPTAILVPFTTPLSSSSSSLPHNALQAPSSGVGFTPTATSSNSSLSVSSGSSSLSAGTAAAGQIVVTQSRPFLWPLNPNNSPAATVLTTSAPPPSPATVTIPSSGSAFRAPLLSHQHRQASLSLPPSGPLGPMLDKMDTSALAMRRHRYHDASDGSGSLCGSVHINEFAHYRLDMKRPSRSRQPVRHGIALTVR